MRFIAALLLSLPCFAGVAIAGDPSLWLNGRVSTVAGVPGIAGNQDGPVIEATFNRPTWLDVVDGGDSCSGGVDGDIYVIDRLNQSIRKISGGVVSTYLMHASTDRSPFVFDFGAALGGGIVMEPPEGGCGCLTYARGMFVTSSGTEQVVLVSLWAGQLGNRDGDQILGQRGVAGAADGFARSALFNNPSGLARSWKYPKFNRQSERSLYVADTGNHTVRRVNFGLSAEGCPDIVGVLTLAGAAGVAGSQDGAGSVARFNSPRGMAAARDGSIYVADTGNHTIRRITADGFVSTLAGEAGVAGSNDGPARQAHLNTPSGIDVNANGDVFIADTGNNVIRMLTSEGMLVTIGGAAGVCGSADGIAEDSRFCTPVGLRIAPDGTVLIADTSNDAIRRLTPSTNRRRAVHH